MCYGICMDPNQCLAEIISNLQSGNFDRERTAELLKGLGIWINAGGFAPLIKTKEIEIHGVNGVV